MFKIRLPIPTCLWILSQDAHTSSFTCYHPLYFRNKVTFMLKQSFTVSCKDSTGRTLVPFIRFPHGYILHSYIFHNYFSDTMCVCSSVILSHVYLPITHQRNLSRHRAITKKAFWVPLLQSYLLTSPHHPKPRQPLIFFFF